MKWFLPAMLTLTFLTLMVSNHNVVATGDVETTFSCQFTKWSYELMGHTPPVSAGLYVLADNGDANNNGDENAETKEKELEADPAGGVDRIWNSVQLA